MFKFFKSKTDPVYRCAVYKTVGCAHVDGPLCDMATCTIAVNVNIRPNNIEEVPDASSPTDAEGRVPCHDAFAAFVELHEQLRNGIHDSETMLDATKCDILNILDKDPQNKHRPMLENLLLKIEQIEDRIDNMAVQQKRITAGFNQSVYDHFEQERGVQT